MYRERERERVSMIYIYILRVWCVCVCVCARVCARIFSLSLSPPPPPHTPPHPLPLSLSRPAFPSLLLKILRCISVSVRYLSYAHTNRPNFRSNSKRYSFAQSCGLYVRM